MLNLLLNNVPVISFDDNTAFTEIRSTIHTYLGLSSREYYLLQNGKIVNDDAEIKHGNIALVLRTYGGKGGFGSMLRAIGAQIEKTTNREACRDLSGRRLRDINEEKRLKKWITQQAEREQEAAQRKQKKLEKLCEIPKHKFEDSDYDSVRSQLPEIVENAVTQGLKATSSNITLGKRKNNKEIETKKKKQKLWIDADVEDDLSASGSEITDDENDIKSPITENSDSISSDNTEIPSTGNEEKVNFKKEETEDVRDLGPSENNNDKETIERKIQQEHKIPIKL